jgi:hypothetical protein
MFSQSAQGSRGTGETVNEQNARSIARKKERFCAWHGEKLRHD